MTTTLVWRLPENLYENMPMLHFPYGSADNFFNHPGLKLMRDRAYRTPYCHITQHARLIGHPFEDCCFSLRNSIDVPLSFPMKLCDEVFLVVVLPEV